MAAAGADDSASPSSTTAGSPTASASGVASSPPLLAASEWSRSALTAQQQPDVQTVRPDLANIALANTHSANSGSSNAANGSASAPPQPPPALHPSSLSLAPPLASSAASSATAPLSAQLLGSMLNLSNQPDESVDAANSNSDSSQWPYSGPQLGRAKMKSAFPAIIPSSARWFDPSEVAAIERRAFPDWLSGAVGRHAAAAAQRSEWYQHIRNAIVAAYRANPRIFLSVTACRRLIAADVGAITRIHAFLQQVRAQADTITPTLAQPHVAQGTPT